MRASGRLLSLLFACGLAVLVAGCSDAQGGKPPPGEPEAIAVRLIEVGAAPDSQVIRAAGTVRFRQETPLAFWVPGRVAGVAVRPGDRVPGGALLATLDARTIDSDVAAAAADLARARAEVARQEALLEKGWVAQARVDQARAGARAAEAALERARFAQANARIRAPADAVVLARLVEPGQTVAAGEPALVLGEVRSGHVLRVPLTAAQAAGLAPGMAAEVDFPDAAAPAMAGRILEIAGRADERTGTFQLEIALPADPALRSGLIGEARIARPKGKAAAPALRVPATALFAARGGDAFVWKHDPARGEVQPVLVRTGEVGADGVEIRSGLAAGDRIVAAGVDRLTAGARVAVAGR
ncbi:MAG: efflux RND transporter periplasmic adaptor subunit [Sphingomonadaceae bacterium]